MFSLVEVIMVGGWVKWRDRSLTWHGSAFVIPLTQGLVTVTEDTKSDVIYNALLSFKNSTPDSYSATLKTSRCNETILNFKKLPPDS